MNFITNLLGWDNASKPEGFPAELKHIQTIRLAMSVLEMNPWMQMPVASKSIFDYLNTYFDYNVKYYAHSWQVRMRRDILFNHQKPSITVGDVTRPLVFPRQMLSKCRDGWANTDKITFMGFKTPKRMDALKRWLKRTYDVDAALENESGYIGNNVEIVWRANRQCFPQKAWDGPYYDGLLSSGFVLCPDGDFIWTYRFFEAVICGAIPIIENMCGLYEGFYFYDMNTPREELIYRPEQAADNFKLLMQKFTLSEKMNA